MNRISWVRVGVFAAVVLSILLCGVTILALFSVGYGSWPTMRPDTSFATETPVMEELPPQVPHTLQNRSNCRLCHETGAGGAPQLPADHVDRANDVCQLCHTASPADNATAREGMMGPGMMGGDWCPFCGGGEGYSGSPFGGIFGWPFMLMGLLFPLGLLGLALVGIIWLVRTIGRPTSGVE